ncbi:hypothetical protein Aph01nite_62480 [Acrocarpospora phusangensis]|uniref:Uncharacterized protein n=1 Tax=Acrocarpospora phusangensis TaxID=1070424 RepID=A0A919QFQ4_9ACTN|nr:hypothetical protein [Acrocarpospora phusangensis]GIH27938.1 hypothetical protein Aph01nite_62480 [Acrocarpospora phusangensis]
MAASPGDLPDIVTYLGERYRPWNGHIYLSWEKQPFLRHRQGCLLCCTVRVASRPGAPLRHPADCGNCGPRWRGTRPDLCQTCGKTAHHLAPTNGRPTHKWCFELAVTAQLLTATHPADIFTSPVEEAA